MKYGHLNLPALAKQHSNLAKMMGRSHLAISVAITFGPRSLVPVENTNIDVTLDIKCIQQPNKL